ncbi:calcineurin A [Ectocarpus siliculosus]|uniref:Calcineurin A n=1 Tax=Ectocarpus siliculosus TaxID=2880 RepID=D7FN83_ECTSI|nr:calcineurin A [Ectocarpus siliculosus]|eukprot:CBJ30140.1 calcineurin A [Ectocarpus siliculosus]
MPNVVRGCSWSYEWKAVEVFLKENLFRGILRAHSVQGEGFHHHFQGQCPESNIGEGVSTVFSAPGYTTHSNRGGVLVVKGDGGVDPQGYDATPEPVVVNSVRAAVQRACPFMPTSLGEWADLDTDRLWSLSSSLPPAVSAAGRRQRSTASFDDTEALALRALWEAMSGGGGAITADSLFAFDDSFGEGTDCLHAAAVLRALAPSGRREAHACEPAMMGDFLRVAGALKEMSAVGSSPGNASGRSTEIDVVESSSENAVVGRSSPENAIAGKSPENAIVGNCSPETAVGNSPNAAMSLGDGTPPDFPRNCDRYPALESGVGG